MISVSYSLPHLHRCPVILRSSPAQILAVITEADDADVRICSRMWQHPLLPPLGVPWFPLKLYIFTDAQIRLYYLGEKVFVMLDLVNEWACHEHSFLLFQMELGWSWMKNLWWQAFVRLQTGRAWQGLMREISLKAAGNPLIWSGSNKDSWTKAVE